MTTSHPTQMDQQSGHSKRQDWSLPTPKGLRELAYKLTDGIMQGHDWPNTQSELDLLTASRAMCALADRIEAEAVAPDLLDIAETLELGLKRGYTPAELLDENSPIRDRIRAAIALATKETT